MRAVHVVMTVLMVAGVCGQASAASNRCVVVEARDNTLILSCDRKTEAFHPGDAVKLKTVRPTSPIEGC